MNDREVIIEAVRQNGDALENASSELQSDLEVVLVAVANDDLFGFSLRHASPSLRYGGLESHVRDLLSYHTVPVYTYLSTILAGISRGRKNTKTVVRGTHLGALDLDEATSAALKMLIADFAGVQYGLKWPTIHAAAANLNIRALELPGV